MLPCGSIAPTSPVRSQPSAVNDSSRVLDPVVVGRRSTGPRTCSSPVALSSQGSSSACRARRSGLSTPTGAIPCRARMSAASSSVSPSSRGSAVERAERAGLGHPPGVQDRDPELLPVRLGQRLRHRRPAAQHQPQRRQVVVVEQRQHAHPDRRYAGGDGHPLLSSSSRRSRRGTSRARQHQLGAGEHAARGPSPRRWRGTSAPPAARCRARWCRCWPTSAAQGVQVVRTGASRARPWGCRWCRTCSTWRRPGPRPRRGTPPAAPPPAGRQSDGSAGRRGSRASAPSSITTICLTVRTSAQRPAAVRAGSGRRRSRRPRRG